MFDHDIAHVFLHQISIVPMPSKSPFMKRTILWSTGSALAAFKPFATIGRKDFRFDKKPTAEKYMNKEGKVKAPSS